MKKRSLFLGVVTAVFLCGCKQNLQTIAMPTLALTPEPNATVTALPTLTPTPEPTATVTALPTLTPTPEPNPTATLITTPTPIPTLTSTPTPVPEPTHVVVPTQAADPFAGDFWCELYAEDTKLRMTPSEITSLNEQNFRAEGTSLVKLSELERIKTSQVLEMIKSYSFPKMKYYGNEVLSEKTKAEILKQRNLDALQSGDAVDLKYGILIQNAKMRSFPAEKSLTAEQNGKYDYLQETVLYLNEAVVVLHTSADGAWCFVQGENYYGWIRENLIAYCEKEEMQQHYKALQDTENSAVGIVTKNVSFESEPGVTYSLRMGTKLFFKPEENGDCVINIPVRTEDKRLKQKQYAVSYEEEKEFLHRGYLPYTTCNIVTLATRLLDTPYAWGDSLPYGDIDSCDREIGMDCSSTVSAVYRCFGFVLPRNTGAQRASVWDGETVSDYKIRQKKELLNHLPAGALLYSPGHVMLYLGSYEGEYFVLHNTTTEFLSDGTEKSYYRCVISPMSLGKRGNTMMEQLSEVKVP